VSVSIGKIRVNNNMLLINLNTPFKTKDLDVSDDTTGKKKK